MRHLSLLLLVAIGSSTALAQSSGLPNGVKNTQNLSDKTISPAESLRRITVPDGFNVSLFAAEPDVGQPIASTFDDRGRLWVAECYSHPVWKPKGNDRILIFEDTDNDGTFDKRKVFWDEGRYLTGLLYGYGGVWICNTPSLMFIPDRNGDDIPDGSPVDLLDGWTRKNPNNVLNNLTWGPDGWLYGCIGNSEESLVGKPGTPEEQRTAIPRGIWRFHSIDRKFEVVAIGAVNPWGLDFNDWGEGFFTNCVIGHLWHLIPGAYYQRRDAEQDNPYAYTRIEPIADHLHWGGGKWTDSRGGKGVHSKAGGGHAHTGAMVYLGDNWPDRYRNTFFTGNIHGNRINNDTLEPEGSGYVAHHGDDFLLGNHDWFRCLWQKYGPDGGVLIGDWHDYGECHDNDGSHRTSGRIYKITYGALPKLKPFDLSKLTDAELVQLQLHKNDWYVRHARRLLHERFLSGSDMEKSRSALRDIFEENEDPTRKLRALWTLNLIGGLSEDCLVEQISNESEHVRAWSVRLLCDKTPPTADVIKQLADLAAKETSPVVRLQLASALQRLPLGHRWDIASGLVRYEQDADDHSLPQMIWYGVEPLVPLDSKRAFQLIVASKIPLIRQHIARRSAEDVSDN